jgi:hypothetical protein
MQANGTRNRGVRLNGHRPQSTSASCLTAGASEFLDVSQSPPAARAIARSQTPGRFSANHCIKRLMIEKLSGQVAYAIMSFGGFMGMGSEKHTIPWRKLNYDTSLGGYRTDITESQLRDAPTFYRDQNWDWSDRNREQELHDYYRAPYYWA